MSSCPPHLPSAITDSRAELGPLDLRPRDRQGGLERARREVGELGRGVVDAEVVRQVAGRQPDEHPAVLHAQGVGRDPARQRGGRELALGIGAHGPQQPRPDGVRRGAGGAEERVGELAPLLRVAHQVVGQRLAGAEHRQQAHRGALVVGQLGDQPGLGPLDEPGETGQRLVGIGGAGQDRHQGLGPVTERGQLVAGPARVREPQQHELPPGAHAARGHRVNLVIGVPAPVGSLAERRPLVQGVRKPSCLMESHATRNARNPRRDGRRSPHRDPRPPARSCRHRSSQGGAAHGYVRVNQQGYLTHEAKQARLMTSAPVPGAPYVVTDAQGHVVLRGVVPAHTTGSWNAAYPAVYRLDLSRLRSSRPLPGLDPRRRDRAVTLVPGARRPTGLQPAAAVRRAVRPQPARRRRRRRGSAAPTPVPPPRPARVGLRVADHAARLRPDHRPSPAPHRRSGRRGRRVVRRRRLPEVHPLRRLRRRAALQQRPPPGAPDTGAAAARGAVRAALAGEDVAPGQPHPADAGRHRVGQPRRHLPRRPRPLAPPAGRRPRHAATPTASSPTGRSSGRRRPATGSAPTWSAG